MKYITTIDGHEYTVEILDEHNVIVDGTHLSIDLESVGGQPIYSLLVNGESYEVHVYPGDEGWQVLVHGTLYPAKVEDEREKRLRLALGGKVMERGEFHLKSPMPGMVISVPVTEGQKVEKGDVLVVLESMKMQNELKSPSPGTVSRIRIKPGDSVEQKQTLLSIV